MGEGFITRIPPPSEDVRTDRLPSCTRHHVIKIMTYGIARDFSPVCLLYLFLRTVPRHHARILRKRYETLP